MLRRRAQGELRLHVQAVDVLHHLLAVRTDGANELGAKNRLEKLHQVQNARRGSVAMAAFGIPASAATSLWAAPRCRKILRAPRRGFRDSVPKETATGRTPNWSVLAVYIFLEVRWHEPNTL